MLPTSRTEHVREVFVFPVFFPAKWSLVKPLWRDEMNLLITQHHHVMSLNRGDMRDHRSRCEGMFAALFDHDDQRVDDGRRGLHFCSSSRDCAESVKKRVA